LKTDPLISNQEISKGFDIPWMGEDKIPWVEGFMYTMDRGFDIPWVGGSKYHVRYTMDRGSI
jgi:hypothetical protein